MLTLLLVTFAMAILMIRRAARLASEKQRLSSELAAAAEVGGDFYQILNRADGSRVALVGDVSGKGLKAARLVCVAIGALRREKSSSPSAILSGLNEAMLGQGGFVNCCCVAYRPGGQIEIASAGHPAAYCDGDEIHLTAGLPLGVIAA